MKEGDEYDEHSEIFQAVKLFCMLLYYAFVKTHRSV